VSPGRVWTNPPPPRLSTRPSSTAGRANERFDRAVKHATANVAAGGKTRRSASKEAAEISFRFRDEPEFLQESDRIGRSIGKIMKQHQQFQPLNAAEKAHKKLLEESAEETKSKGKALSLDEREEQLERFKLLRYVRKIEPEVPPMEDDGPLFKEPPRD
jgi:hypothetical protein